VLFSNPAGTPAQRITQWHGVCDASLEAELDGARFALAQSIPFKAAIACALPIGSSLENVEAYFRSSKKEIEIAAILTIVANMEARVRLDAANRSKTPHANGLIGGRLRQLHDKARKTWQIPLYENGILDAWKMAAAAVAYPSLAIATGRFSALLQIRHWAAHGRYWALKRSIDSVTSAEASATVVQLANELDAFCRHQGWPPFPSI
jgi:hypothetical protein